jgi:glycerol-3-phosphate O-acyltransferase
MEPPIAEYNIEDNGCEEDKDVEDVDAYTQDALEEVDVAAVGEEVKDRKTRVINCSEVEDTCLVRAWSQVSMDAVHGTDQTGKHYWQRIKDKFFHLVPHVKIPVTRSYRSLQGRWDVIKVCCSR